MVKWLNLAYRRLVKKISLNHKDSHLIFLNPQFIDSNSFSAKTSLADKNKTPSISQKFSPITPQLFSKVTFALESH